VLDFLKTKSETLILRKFIQHKEQARLIVMGNEVLAYHTNIASLDFRTNVGDNNSRKRMVKEYSEAIKNIAVKAVNLLGYELGGVDILFDEETNMPYIAEINFPCYFPTTQRLTGIDISGAMIDFLIKKSNVNPPQNN
jgi:glutathione synthase/RimK-type ligase-like ATP-grasp enzyme